MENAVATKKIGVLVDMPNLKEEFEDAPFPTIIDRLITEIIPRYRRREEKRAVDSVGLSRLRSKSLFVPSEEYVIE
jgi:hypothetical protein